jgi:hypothetical protein
MSDPYQDPDALWRQYCDDMYGAASESMYRFFGMFADKHLYSDRYYVRDDLPRREMAGFTEADLALQRSRLEQAIELTRDDPLIQKRLAAVMRYFRGHELWAQAIGVPARAFHRHTTLANSQDVNREALAFYVNDDGARMMEAIRYYDQERTILPDSHQTATYLGAELSYRANYSRALGTILQTIRMQAMQGIDPAQATAQTVDQITARAVEIYRGNLPAKYNPQRAAEIESLFRKTLWIPRSPAGQAMPAIDGRLDDEAWKEAAPLTDFTLADLILPTREGNQTRGRIMRSGDHLVIGIACEQPGGTWASTPPDVHTGTRIWRESCCEIFVGPQPRPGEQAPYAQYIVNALGAFRGFQAARDNREGVQAAGVIAPDGRSYTVEIAIPLRVAGRYDFTGEQALSFTVMRQVYLADTFSPPERLGWHPLFLTAHNAESRGLVFLE